ncbi:MAG: DUF4124 domain-containing protein [Gammaproteobacteria bacterium]|nr:DUF4124 domain-containing protein [Gammaproteobacteria bacterium]
MKLFGKLLIAALVLSVLLPFTILKGKDGRPLMSFSDIKAPSLSLPSMPDMPDLANNAKPSPVSGGKDIIYKWKDSKGVLHFSSSPPPEGIEFTSKGYDPNANLIQSVEVITEPTEQLRPQEKQAQAPSDIGNPYSPAKVEKLFKDAQNVEKLLNDRLKHQEALIN